MPYHADRRPILRLIEGAPRRDRAGWNDRAGPERFWAHWMSVVEEVGERYGDLLAGWWIDDAMTGARG